MKVPSLLCTAFCCLLFNTCTSFADAPKVIIDTDFNTIGDDGQVAVMAAQLYAQGVIDLLGFTIASGNEWRDQEVAECLKAVERLGIENRVKVYVGAQYPLLHDYKSYLYEVLLFGQPIDYVGAYASPQPNPNQLVPPPDGFATHTRLPSISRKRSSPSSMRKPLPLSSVLRLRRILCLFSTPRRSPLW